MASVLPNVSAQTAAFALYQLDTPAVHPDSVIQCIKAVTQDVRSLASVFQTDPALAVAFINIFRQHNIEVDFENWNVEQCAEKIPSGELLKKLLSVKTFDTAGLHSQLPIAQLNRLAAVRAFAAKLIAAATNMNESLAFCAALFADIGLFAIAELYPKGLAGMYADAAGDCTALLSLEKQNLGIAHNVISRQLLQKWRFPQTVADCAWLYCSPVVEKIESLPNFEYIMIVRLADIIARSIDSGDGIAVPSVIPISPDEVSDISKKSYNFASQLGNAEEKSEGRVMKQALMALLGKPAEQDIADFQTILWNAVKPAVSVSQTAGIICGLLCEKLNAQKACIYIGESKEAIRTAAGNTEFLVFDTPPTSRQINFADAETKRIEMKDIGWLIVQMAQDFNITALAAAVTQILAAKAAEEYNLSIAQALLESFSAGVAPIQPAAAAQPVMPSQAASAAPPASQPIQQTASQTSAQMRDRIAEIAAGAAHELNNPLTVISGRAQLLKQQETDPTKRLMLEQITEKTEQAYEIVGQLMSYARPAIPNIRTVSPFIMLNNCIEKVNARYLDEPVDVTIDSSIENLNDVEVDSEQVIEALTQIIFNSLESYESGNGPVIISGSEHIAGQVEIRIQDQGCGMSGETLRKAVEPFYSDKPAGRQRGMGLAIASSLLQNNGGQLAIESQIDKGTTVYVRLPKAGTSA